MKKEGTLDIKEERGEVMLEASIIMVPVLLILMALLSISFLFYQKAMITTLATETAADIAQNYKFNKEVSVGNKVVTENNVKAEKMYRMSFQQKGAVQKVLKDKANEYVASELVSRSLGIDSETPSVECKITSTAIGRAFVEVTVSHKTDFFLSDILDFLGIADKKATFTTVAYAECFDYTAYASMINFTEYASGALHMFEPLGNVYVSVKGLCDTIAGFLE